MSVLADIRINFIPMNWPEAIVTVVFIVVAGVLLWKLMDDGE